VDASFQTRTLIFECAMWYFALLKNLNEDLFQIMRIVEAWLQIYLTHTDIRYFHSYHQSVFSFLETEWPMFHVWDSVGVP
jgi:hypothetical protein